MKHIMISILLCGIAATLGAQSTASFFDFSAKDWQGNPVDLDQYKGQVVLVVNTASNCGFAGQMGGLQKLYETYRGQGFVVLAFPSNDFLGQEPFGNLRIRQLAVEKYQVTFPQMDKIRVKGQGIHPVYQHLTGPHQPEGIRGDIQWNFNKFLIGRDGQVVARFESSVEPLSKAVTESLQTALKASRWP